MPSSCFDLERMGHKLSGFFSVKGSKKMEMIFCDFNPNQNGIGVYCFLFHSFNWSSNYFLIDRQTKMDRIQRRQIDARPFLRPAQFFVFQLRSFSSNSNSVRIGGGERGKRHEFDVGDIHGTATGNLFLLIYGTCGISSFIICCWVRSFSLFERGSNRVGFCFRVKHRWSR